MGSSRKKMRKSRDSDDELEDQDDMQNQDLMMAGLDRDFDDAEEDEEDEDMERQDEDEEEADEEQDDIESEEMGSSEEEGLGEEAGEIQNDYHKNDELEDLEKERKDIQNQELDLLKNLKRHKEEDVLKGQAVKNQKTIWNRGLELRMLLQKAFPSSNRLPLEPVRSTFCNSEEEVRVAYDDLISSSKKTLESLVELQEALLEKNPSVSQSSNGNVGKPVKKQSDDSKSLSDEDEEWSKISQMHTRVAPFRNKSIDKWQRKTEVTTGVAAIRNKLQAFNQNISEQVSAYMRDPSRMVKQMHLRKSDVNIFGPVPEQAGSRDGKATLPDGELAPDKASSTNGKETHPDGDPELLDDTEFYKQLLKEFFEALDPNSSEMAFYAVKRVQTKKRKEVERRASKSRKIRYNVHEKIVNFMAKRPEDIPDMAPKLFENLFGLKTQNR
ncbi:unnamed protein product [Linum tenue]|nr:unnamed protein product [Linum tenue]